MVCCLKYSSQSQYRFLNWNAFLDSVNSVIICIVITYIYSNSTAPCLYFLYHYVHRRKPRWGLNYSVGSNIIRIQINSVLFEVVH